MDKYIKKNAKTKGFDLCGIAPCHPLPDYGRQVGGWIAEGRHAGMAWIERNGDLRSDPARLVPGTRSVVVVGKYYNNRPYDLTAPRIARYAQNTDYHRTLRQMLEELLGELGREFGTGGKCFVDSAPVAERYWAVQAGLGWIGKSGNLINREYGGFLLLGTLLLDRACDAYDEPDPFNGCGSCRKCLDACPGNAILDNGRVDCRRCVSYLTVEHRGDFTPEQARLREGWLYGCDRCTEVCPWSERAFRKFGITDTTPFPYTREEFLRAGELPNRLFRQKFGPTPLFHSGRKNILRNLGLFSPTEEPQLFKK